MNEMPFCSRLDNQIDAFDCWVDSPSAGSDPQKPPWIRDAEAARCRNNSWSLSRQPSVHGGSARVPLSDLLSNPGIETPLLITDWLRAGRPFLSLRLLTGDLCVFFCAAEYADASLSSWVNKERFQGYLQIDGFTLYELGETGDAWVTFFHPPVVTNESFPRSSPQKHPIGQRKQVTYGCFCLF